MSGVRGIESARFTCPECGRWIAGSVNPENIYEVRLRPHNTDVTTYAGPAPRCKSSGRYVNPDADSGRNRS